MIILLEVLFLIAVAYVLYRLAFSYKLINQAASITIIALIFIIAPMQIKVLVLTAVIIFTFSNIILKSSKKNHSAV